MMVELLKTKELSGICPKLFDQYVEYKFIDCIASKF